LKRIEKNTCLALALIHHLRITFGIPLKKQFELFLLLARRPNKVFSREKIYNKIWGDTIVSDRTIDVHITRIRNKLKIDCIKSVKGVGYKFVLDT